ncbi:PA14 domain-containing protein [Dyadobacter sp. CY107]|uniref:PA14 domain-containing protein n=1 Tax=Dyadobacter fanqingshengii TaxID=2906443 RepID=UPI001F1E46B1|nr:PA14 domain-containing protein [Dyadobacter fanqingshengii]MCF2502107.1 PA14 domain-containing protein [Dyadobacter fanqingshengii]
MKLAICTLLLGLSLTAQAQVKTDSVFIAEHDSVNPWTNTKFYNRPENFQFAIVSDRTGGHRPGIFESGLQKVNQLMPEFVLSVGDFIEGYTRDTTEINAQWKEIQGFVGQLNMPFFYLPGNHDISNEVMRQAWQQRFGRRYYHFLYRDVLFLMMDSNKGNAGMDFGDEQIAYILQAIKHNPKARWTFVLMHHPVWTYRDFNGFDKIEQALQNRPYSVIAGHHHRYLYSSRHERNYYILGTTGGGSKLRGPKFGEFDHITWITMKDQGPQLVNLTLDGILPHDVATQANDLLSEHLTATVKDFKHVLMLSPTGAPQIGKLTLRLHNPAPKPLVLTGAFSHHHQLSVSQPRFTYTIAPGGELSLPMDVKSERAWSLKEVDPLDLNWTMNYQNDSLKLSLDGRLSVPIVPSVVNLIQADHNEFYKELRVSMVTKKDTIVRYTLDGSEPSINSAIYTYPFHLKETTVVKACLFTADGNYQSGVQERKFEKKPPLPALAFQHRLLKKGLNYSYFEGAYRRLIEIDTATVQEKGIIGTLDVSKVQKRADHFAVYYSGLIDIPQEGSYTFFTNSNDGSKLIIDGQLVVNNDGLHAFREVRGNIILAKGLHTIAIQYFDNTTDQGLELYYNTEVSLKRKVPNSWFFYQKGK